MRNYLLIVFLVLLPFVIKSQVISKNNVEINGNKYDSYIIKVDNYSLGKFQILENKQGISHQNFIKEYSKLNNSFQGNNDFFMTTASIVDSYCQPIGFYVRNYEEIKPINTDEGTGNFYLKPNGAFLVTDKDVIVCESSQINNYSNVRIGIQSGPMLVVDQKINEKFNVGSTSKHIRSGVGMFTNENGSKFIVFSISNQPITFYELAEYFLIEYGCTEALCIESARSVMTLPFINNNTANSDEVVCRYIYFNNERK
jgi:uncharacterized protein YigE (DUF2233 family)